MDNKLENIGFLLRTILNVVDVCFPNKRLNQLALDEKRAFIVSIMDFSHRIVRLNSNLSIEPNTNTKEG